MYDKSDFLNTVLDQRPSFSISVSCNERIILFGESLDLCAIHKSLDLLKDFADRRLPLDISIRSVYRLPVNSVRYIPIESFTPRSSPADLKYGYIISADDLDDVDDLDDDDDDDDEYAPA